MKLISIIVFCIVLGGCSDSSPFLPEKPDNLLSETQFKSVFSDMLLSEMSVQSKISSPIQINKEVNLLGKEILKKHHVDSSQYAQSFDYYASDKDKMEQIYNEVLEKFNEEKEKLSAQ